MLTIKDTPENRTWWKFIEDTSHRVSHWPTWKGGEGIPIETCERCNPKPQPEPEPEDFLEAILIIWRR